MKNNPNYRAAERYNVTAHHKQVHQGIKRVAKKYNKPPKMDNEPLSSLGEPTIPTKVIFEDLWKCSCIYFIITALYIVWEDRVGLVAAHSWWANTMYSALVLQQSPLIGVWCTEMLGSVDIVALLFSVMGICGRIRFFNQPDFVSRPSKSFFIVSVLAEFKHPFRAALNLEI